MKVKYLIIFIFHSLLAISFTHAAWNQKANFGGVARARAVGFCIGTKGYIGTGWNGSTIHYKDFWEWDQATNVWTQKADFGGVARRNAVGFSVGAKGYIGTGYDNVNYYNDYWEYDPSLNSWTQKANLTTTGRIAPTAFSIGTKGYIGTGSYTGVLYSDLWEWDQGTNIWTQKDNLGGVARETATSFSIGAKGYIGTGYNWMTGAFLKDFWEWDQASNTWSQKADFAGGRRRDAVSFSIGTKGYIGTGDSVQNGYTADIWEWDQATNGWTQIANLGATARRESTSFSIGTCGYIGTGTNGTLFQDLWEICFAAVLSPVSNFTSSDTLFCANGCINFTDLSTGGPTSWLWSFPGGLPSSSTVQNPTQVCYTDSGFFNVSLIATNTGGSDTLTLNNFIKVTPAPITPVITKSNDTLYCSTDSSYSSYQWYSDSVLISGATNSFLYITQSGNYNVKVTNIHGCISATGIVLEVQNSFLNPQVKISPNPAGSSLTIHNSGVTIKKVEIFNVLGIKMNYPTLKPLNLTSEVNVNISSFPSGLYFITIMTDHQGLSFMFVHDQSH